MSGKSGLGNHELKEAVSSVAYLKALEQLGINVNAKNFLVFQVRKHIMVLS